MKVVNKDEMEEIDRKASSDYGIPSSILMENAGIALAQKVLEIYPNIKDLRTKLIILAGPGNNGGDGLVMARWFHTHHIPVHVYLFSKIESVKGDPLINLNIIQKLSIPHTNIQHINDWNSHKKNIFNHKYIIDSLFGTGLRGEVRGFFQVIIRDINDVHMEKTFDIVSIDIPSGMICLEDHHNEYVISADHTITVALPKINMLDYPEKNSVGHLHVVQIGFPEGLLTNKSIKGNWLTQNIIKSLIPKRPSDSHKGTYGHLLVIAGSKLYTGSAILTCESAIRSGCGLVTLASLPSVCQVMRNRLPEIICKDLTGNNDMYIDDTMMDELKSTINNYQGIIFGPGVGQNASTMAFLKELLFIYEGNLLIDADGLNLLSEDNELLHNTKSSVILTPHIKEMSRLTRKDVQEIIQNKISITRHFAKEHQVITVLKSSVTLIVDKDENFYYNSTGNEGMATAGSGDVLSGIIGGFMVQNTGLIESGLLGVYIHGLAGDIAKSKLSSESLTAVDITQSLSKAFRSINNLNGDLL